MTADPELSTMPWTNDSIETDRLRLRAFREDDKPAILAMASDPDVRRYLGGPLPADAIDAIRKSPVGERWGVFCIADLATDVAIGRIGFGRDRDELEVSYELLTASWGHGLGAEAVTAALAWVWEHTDDTSVIAVTQSANEPSLRLLRHLGFGLEREFEEFGAAQSLLRLDRPPADPI
ncbi:MAG: GNAT family N-acetyltransferase [Ilumatobacter sp.]|uniref:GNAT family N-acetyltransferase n=1 Tax=Ilumatobacter sp. TaxID=1967498 RepID=UPI00263A2355|nr:GNAT family N-acetyltransferase [Ilumatobacter sp.]MDJ0769393.1 GNAT family N-acetyltransferase [Ilumatobacter sp.]